MPHDIYLSLPQACEYMYVLTLSPQIHTHTYSHRDIRGREIKRWSHRETGTETERETERGRKRRRWEGERKNKKRYPMNKQGNLEKLFKESI